MYIGLPGLYRNSKMRRCACIAVWELLAILGLTKNLLYSEFPNIFKGKVSEMKKTLVDVANKRLSLSH